MKILLVEDNITFGEELKNKLRSRFGTPEWMQTESEFVQKFDDIVARRPSLAIIDVMLKWDVPRRGGVPIPPEKPDMYRAGIRCAKKLMTHPHTQRLPIILFTLVDQPDIEADIKADLTSLGGNIHYLQKSSDLDPVVDKIREITSGHALAARN